MKNDARKIADNFLSGMRHLVSFCVAGFIPTLLILCVYFVGTGTPKNLLTWIYAPSITGFYFTIALVMTLALSPLYFLRHARYLVIAPLVCLDFYLFVDIFIYNIFRFHLDAVFLYILVKDFYGIGIPFYIIILLILALAGIIAGNIFLFRRAKAFGKWPVKAALAAVAFLAAGQCIHIWGAEFGQGYIMKYTTDFPYYYPIKAGKFMHKLAKRYHFIIPAQPGDKGLSLGDEQDSGNLALDYPLKKISCTLPQGEKPNVLFFLLESWRSDMMDSSVTPFIDGLAKKGYFFANHLSGGNVTPTGLYSIMYGLHPTYMKYMEAEPRLYPPVFMTVLRDNGYEESAYTSSNLDGFSLKEMFFGGIPLEEFSVHYGSDNSANDRKVVSDLIRSIHEAKPGKPFFKFVFLTSSHHGYNYPEDQTVFKPVSKESSFIFNKYADPAPLLNRYKNALHYDDALFGEVLAALKGKHLDRNTIIVVSSDHGEEFNDRGRGYWGHGSDFTRYQTSVPLVLYLPGRAGGQVIHERSAHIDVVPTLMNAMFLHAGDISDYSSGADLFHIPEHRGLIVKSYVNKACIIDDTVYAESIPLNRYFFDDVGRKSTQFDYKAIELMKVSESWFVRRKS